jgi:hypothetical protein
MGKSGLVHNLVCKRQHRQHDRLQCSVQIYANFRVAKVDNNAYSRLGHTQVQQEDVFHSHLS